MLVAYLVALGGAFSNPDGTAAVALSLVPFALAAALAVTLMLAAIAGLVRLGGRMYELGLLRSGPRVPFREAPRTARSR